MTTEDYDVAADADDFWVASDIGQQNGTTTLYFQYTNIAPAVWAEAFANLDTSAIPDDATITAATVFWYMHARHVSGFPRPPTHYYKVYIRPNAGGWTNFFTFGPGGTPALGWTSHALTAGELSKVNLTGMTSLKFDVPAPGSNQGREYYIRAREHATADTYDCYIRVTYTVPSGSVFTAIFG